MKLDTDTACEFPHDPPFVTHRRGGGAVIGYVAAYAEQGPPHLHLRAWFREKREDGSRGGPWIGTGRGVAIKNLAEADALIAALPELRRRLAEALSHEGERKAALARARKERRITVVS